MAKQKPYTIHFVCRGNTYRSRLAAAYMASVLDERFAVTSSGIAPTSRVPEQTIEAYAKLVALTHGLTHGIAGKRVQTTDEMLAAADVVVFMNRDVYDEAQQRFAVDSRKTEVWHIADLSPAVRLQYDTHHDLSAIEPVAEHTFQLIRRKCDELRQYLTATGSWNDIVDEHNRAVNFRLPINWVTDRGLWHRGVHVVVRTQDGKFVVGKRSSSIIFAPGMLEISLGGSLDAGETPLQAARRETHEELGIDLPGHLFKPMFMYRQISYHPHYRKKTRVHLYVYTVRLSVPSSAIRPQPSEVAEVRVLSKRQVRRLLNTHRVRHFGRLKWGYQLYRKAVAYSMLPL